MSEQQTEAQAGKPEFTPPATQADLDRIIAERLHRERAKYADYQDLRKKAEQFDQLQESQKTELEKAIARAEKAERAAAEFKQSIQFGLRTGSSRSRKNTACQLKRSGAAIQLRVLRSFRRYIHASLLRTRCGSSARLRCHLCDRWLLQCVHALAGTRCTTRRSSRWR